MTRLFSFFDKFDKKERSELAKTVTTEADARKIREQYGKMLEAPIITFGDVSIPNPNWKPPIQRAERATTSDRRHTTFIPSSRTSPSGHGDPSNRRATHPAAPRVPSYDCPRLYRNSALPVARSNLGEISFPLPNPHSEEKHSDLPDAPITIQVDAIPCKSKRFTSFVPPQTACLQLQDGELPTAIHPPTKRRVSLAPPHDTSPVPKPAHRENWKAVNAERTAHITTLTAHIHIPIQAEIVDSRREWPGADRSFVKISGANLSPNLSGEIPGTISRTASKTSIYLSESGVDQPRARLIQTPCH